MKVLGYRRGFFLRAALKVLAVVSGHSVSSTRQVQRAVVRAVDGGNAATTEDVGEFVKKLNDTRLDLGPLELACIVLFRRFGETTASPLTRKHDQALSIEVTPESQRSFVQIALPGCICVAREAGKGHGPPSPRNSLRSTPVIRYCVNQMAADGQRAREFDAVLRAGERNRLFAALSQQQARAIVGIQSLRISLCGLKIYERRR